MPGQPCWYEQQMHVQHMQHMQPFYATCQREPRLRNHAAGANSAFAFKALETSIGRSRTRSEGFSFYFGGLGMSGGGEVFARRRFCVRNRLQPSATIPDDSAIGVPMGSAAKVGGRRSTL